MRSVKILLFSLVVALFCSSGWCALDVNIPQSNDVRKNLPAQLRAAWAAIVDGTDSALKITNAKVADGAAIADSKLAQIASPSKVSGAALTLLGSVPSGSTPLPMAAGGSGQTTRQAALDALSATTLSGTAGKALTSDGTNMSLGYPSSLTIASAATGDVLYYNGTAWTRLAPGTTDYPLVSNGAGSAPAYEKVSLTAGVQGVLPVANGGTNATSLTDLGLPTQTGNSGKFLMTNGSASSWGSVSTVPVLLATDKVTVLAQANTERLHQSATYTKVKEITLAGSGTLYFTWSQRSTGGWAVAKIYRNGVAIEASYAETQSASYVTKTAEIAGWSNGDKIQLYTANLTGSYYVYIKDFKVFGNANNIDID